MSFLQVIEDCGGKYFANGVQQDALRILSNHGVNSITTMTFIHAGNKIYNWSPIAEMSVSHTGYDGEPVTGRQQVDGYFDKTHTIAIAKRAQELGMTFTLGIHYSDTWMTAGKAHMPYEWFEQDYEGNLSNPDIKMLTTATYNYVYDLLSDMKKAGVTNLISVKNGNEQNSGVLFPIGMGSNYSEHAAVVNASIEAVRKVYPGVVNTIHSNTGYDVTQYTGFLNNLRTRGAGYDGTAFSLYAGRGIASQFNMMIAALENDAFKYYDYYNVETAMSFVTSSTIGDTSDSTMVMTDYYDATPNGQYNYLLDYMEAPLEMPNPYGVLRGFYYWNTEAIAVYGAGHKVGEGPGAMKRIMFNNGTASIREMGSSEDGKMGDMMDSMYAYLHRGSSKVVSDEVYTPIQYSGVRFSVTEAESISLETENISLQVGQTQRLHHTIAPEDKLLKDYSVSYESSDAGVAEVSPFGFVTARKAGTAMITATIGSVSDTVMVTVSEAASPSGMSISYDIIRDKVSVETGTVQEGGRLTVQPYDKVKFTTKLEGSPTDKEIIYTVSDSEIAEWYGQTWQTDGITMRTLDKTFSDKEFKSVVQLNPRRGGTATITASASGGTKITFMVDVSADSVTGVTIQGEKERSTHVGKKIQLVANIEPADAVLNKINWSSSDETVATVDKNGLVTCVASGVTEIMAVSDANGSAKDIVTLIVTQVGVEEILLSRSKLAVLVGDVKKLSVTVLPADAANKAVEWRLTEGSDIISIENGMITGLREGVATVDVVAADGSGVKAECQVFVQSTPVAVAEMFLPDALWIKSSYFSPDVNVKGENQPVCQLEPIFEPENATNTEVTWSSSNPAIASVDANGLVTASKGGMAIITATAKDGGYEAHTVIYVPSVSEDWENYDVGSTGGFADDDTFTYHVKESGNNQILEAVSTGEGTGRRSFSRVSGDKVVMEFDWDTGGTGGISVEDGSRNTWIQFLSGSDTELQYVYDGVTAPVGSGLTTGAGQVYHIRLELDFIQEKIGITVSDQNDADKKETASLNMVGSEDFEKNIAAIAFVSSGTWTTAIDNLSVYNASTAVSVERIDYTVDCINLSTTYGIKLVPVEGALSAEAVIKAKVLPEDAAVKGLIYETSDEIAEWIDIDENGVVTIKEEKRVSFENAFTVPALSGTIRIRASQNPDIYEEIKVTIGSPSTNETHGVYVNGEAYLSGIVRLPLGNPAKLSYTATGGDGITDVYLYKWTARENSIGAKIENNILTAQAAGKVIVDFELRLFSGTPITYTLELEYIELEIAVEGTDYKWSSFQIEDTPTLYFNKARTIKITGAAENIQYYLAEGEQADWMMSMEEVEELTGWNNYTQSVPLFSDGKYVVYVKFAESGSNPVYISSERLVVDSEPPSIVGIENEEIYTGNVTFTVTDEYGLDQVTVDSREVQPNENGSYTIIADNKEHTIIAADKAQNSVTYKITVNKKEGTGGQVPTYSVTFVDAQGQQIGETQTVSEGEDAVEPEVPEREGYTFTGWSGSYKNIRENTVLKAEYQAIEYSITYELDGAANAAENPAGYTIETETIELQNPTKEGFTFMGWYDNSAFDGDAILQITKGSTGDRIFYARWIANDMVCRVIFVDASGNQIEEQLVEKGKDAVPPSAPERAGYTFAGWDGSYTNVTEDTTITARYDVITYKITYELNGGTNAQTNPESYTVETETIILQAPEKENESFMGWYDNSAYEGNVITQVTKGSTGDKTFYARWIPIGLWMTEPEVQTYTGSSVKPTDFTVYDGITELTAGVDYTISYKNNTKANKLETEAEQKKAPIVIIKGKGNYSGTVTKIFQILPFNIESEKIQIDDLAAAYKKNKTQKAVPVVKWGNKKLVANKDYQMQGNISYSEPGTYPITIKGIGNFTGERTIYFTIASTDEKLISKVKASKIPNQAYSGEAVRLTKDLLKLTDGTYILEEHTDYELEYGECVNAGTYDVLIRGKGKYKGVRRTSFQITGTPIKNITTAWDLYTYSGTEQTPKPVITLKGKNETLQEGKDYEIVSYSNNVNAGTAKAVIAGRGAYSGTTTVSFKIKAADLSDTTIAFMNGNKEQPYEKGGVKPKVIVSFNGEILTEGSDYTVTYKNNTAYPQKAGKDPAVVIKGKKNFAGNRQETFTITPQDISNIALMFAPDVEANKKAGKFYSTPQLFDSNGKKLTAGKDYEKTFVYRDAGGNELSKADKPEAGDAVMVLVKGKGAYTGEKTAEYHILPKGVNIAKAKVKLQNKFYYTGRDIMPKADDLMVTLKNGKITHQLKLGTDYRLIPYPNNPKKGKLKFLLVGQNDFGGTKTVTVTVRPQIMKWRK